LPSDRQEPSNLFSISRGCKVFIMRYGSGSPRSFHTRMMRVSRSPTLEGISARVGRRFADAALGTHFRGNLPHV